MQPLLCWQVNQANVWDPGVCPQFAAIPGCFKVSLPLLNPFRNCDSTSSLGNLFECLTTLLVKVFFVIYNLNCPWHNLRSFPLVPLPVTWEQKNALEPLMALGHPAEAKIVSLVEIHVLCLDRHRATSYSSGCPHPLFGCIWHLSIISTQVSDDEWTVFCPKGQQWGQRYYGTLFSVPNLKLGKDKNIHCSSANLPFRLENRQWLLFPFYTCVDRMHWKRERQN